MRTATGVAQWFFSELACIQPFQDKRELKVVTVSGVLVFVVVPYQVLVVVALDLDGGNLERID